MIENDQQLFQMVRLFQTFLSTINGVSFIVGAFFTVVSISSTGWEGIRDILQTIRMFRASDLFTVHFNFAPVSMPFLFSQPPLAGHIVHWHGRLDALVVPFAAPINVIAIARIFSFEWLPMVWFVSTIDTPVVKIFSGHLIPSTPS